MVRLGDGLPPCPFCGHSDFDQWPCEYIDASGANVVRCARCHAAAPMKVWHTLSAQPSPGGQGDALVEAAMVIANAAHDRALMSDILSGMRAHEAQSLRSAILALDAALAARQPVVVDLPESLHDRVEALREVAARQPVGQGDAPPCWWIDHGTYGQITQRQDEADAAANAGKRVVSYAARQPVGEPVIWVSPGQLAAHKDRVPGDGGAYLPARLTRDGQFTKPLYATPAQAVDLDAMRALLQRRIEQWRSHLPADPGAPGTREIETKGEHDYNNDVRIYREGIAVMEEVLSKIDGQAVGNG